MHSLKYWIIAFAGLSLIPAHTAQPSPSPVNLRLTVELQDGSKLIGTSGDDSFLFESDVLGEIKLPLEKIRAVVHLPKTNSVTVTTTNGDTLSARTAMREVRLRTAFGNFAVPIDLIRRIAVSSPRKEGRMRPGLVALWSGEDDGSDSLGGSEANLKDMGFADGQVGRAFVLNGFSSHARIAENPSLNVGGGDGLTISAWIKPTDVSGFHLILEWNRGDTARNQLGVQLLLGQRPDSQGMLGTAVVGVDGQPHELFSQPGAVVPVRFQFVAVTYDKASGFGTLYLNGIVVAREQWGSFVPATTGDVWISRRPGDRPGDWTFNRFFSGSLDEVAIYDRALSVAEIRAIGLEENHGEPLLPPPAVPPIRGRGAAPAAPRELFFDGPIR